MILGAVSILILLAGVGMWANGIVVYKFEYVIAGAIISMLGVAGVLLSWAIVRSIFI